MNIFIKKQEKQYKKYKKLFNQKDSELLFQKIKFLKESNNPKYSEFYNLIESIKINDYNIEFEGILNYLTIIKLKDNKILAFFDKNDYSKFESDLNNFIEKINEDINFFKSFKDKSNKPLLNSIACLVGLACGDALGTTLEFTQPDPDVFIDDIVGGGVFKLKAGEWTDDMSMALCISKSLLEHGFSLKEQMENYAQWMRYGYLSSNGRCFDVGVTTSNAIKKYLHMQNPVAGSKEVYHSGNGSIMRLAPIPIFYHNNINDTIKFSGESSITTHGSNECIESCMLLGAILNLFINNNGKSKEDILFNSNLDKILINQFNIKEQKVIDLLTGHSWLNLEYKDLPNSGYVIDTLISALWCFYYSDNFKDAVVKAVNLCGDADTIGAVCGQLSGAYYGYHDIPQNWVKILSKSTYIQKEAYNLFKK